MDKKVDGLIKYIFLLIFLILTLVPLIWCFIISVTPKFDVFTFKGFIPGKMILDNYKEIFDTTSSAHEVLFDGLKNSIITSAITIFIGIPLCIASAYAFSRYRFRGKKLVLNFLLITLVIPLFTTIIPIYALFSNYGMLNNLFWISIIYITAFVPMTTWIIMNYFNSIPNEIWEAAKIDGCNEIQIFFKIILPISYPIIIAAILIMFLMSWNQFQIPMILTASQDKKVVTLIMSEFTGRNTISYGMIAACGLISILPPALLTIFFRRYLVSGLTYGSVKG